MALRRGAFDDAEAQKRFDAWKNGKDAKASAVREGDAKAKKEAAAKELEAEKKMNEAIAKKVAEKKAAAAAAEAEAEAAEASSCRGGSRLRLNLRQNLLLRF